MTALSGLVEGRVVDFDEQRGLGEIEVLGGGRFPFHCTEIAGGTRTIEPGTRVTFRRRAGRSGRWEAGDVTPVP